MILKKYYPHLTIFPFIPAASVVLDWNQARLQQLSVRPNSTTGLTSVIRPWRVVTRHEANEASSDVITYLGQVPHCDGVVSPVLLISTGQDGLAARASVPAD